MFCPNCGKRHGRYDQFCASCGMALKVAPRKNKGRHWVPILIMALIFSFGTTLFFLLPGTSAPASKPAPASDATPWFEIEDGTLRFNKNAYNGSDDLVIPDTIDGMHVTALAEGCFRHCVGLTSITLPDTLLAIGEEAFKGCTDLRGIEIPESVVFIGESAFAHCTGLEAICVYDSLQSVGKGAFSGCSKLFYIYFSGDFQDWDNLYGEYINPYATVFSNDGTFYQGKQP